MGQVGAAVCASATCGLSIPGQNVSCYKSNDFVHYSEQTCKDCRWLHDLTCNIFAHLQKRRALHGTRLNYSNPQHCRPQQPFQINKALQVCCVQHERRRATACPALSKRRCTRDWRQILDMLFQFQSQILESLTTPQMRPNCDCSNQRHICRVRSVKSESQAE